MHQPLSEVGRPAGQECVWTAAGLPPASAARSSPDWSGPQDRSRRPSTEHRSTHHVHLWANGAPEGRCRPSQGTESERRWASCPAVSVSCCLAVCLSPAVCPSPAVCLSPAVCPSPAVGLCVRPVFLAPVIRGEFCPAGTPSACGRLSPGVLAFLAPHCQPLCSGLVAF